MYITKIKLLPDDTRDMVKQIMSPLQLEWFEKRGAAAVTMTPFFWFSHEHGRHIWLVRYKEEVWREWHLESFFS